MVPILLLRLIWIIDTLPYDDDDGLVYINNEYDNHRKVFIAFCRNQPQPYHVKTEPRAFICIHKHSRVLPSQANREDEFVFTPDLNEDYNFLCNSFASKSNNYVKQSGETVKPPNCCY